MSETTLRSACAVVYRARMCLSVYLGTSRPLAMPGSAIGHLGIEKAVRTPPPLKSGHAFVYYVGARGPDSKLACSCLLMEWVEWTDSGPSVISDAPDDPPCPFDDLRALCDEATRDGGSATIVSDDSGGIEIECDEAHYCRAPIRLHSIVRGNLLFGDLGGMFPWRALDVIR